MTSTKKRRCRFLAPAAIAAVFAVFVLTYWCGIGPGDAERYLKPALRWREGAFLGDTHWALRHLFVMPIAASFAAFGPSELAATLPNLVYAALTVAVSWMFARRFLGAGAAFVASALIASSAFFVARPLELDVYGAEAFFAVSAVWLFVAAGASKERDKYLVAAGLAAGLGWTVREQSSLLMAAFGVLIVLERREVVRSLVLVVAGFAAVLAVEMLVYAIAASDAFYRYKIDLGHREIGVNDAMTVERARLTARIARGATYLITTPATTPMLLFAAAGGWYLWRVKALTGAASQSMKAFGAAAILSAALSPVVFNLSATRYYPILTYTAFLIVGAAVAALWSRGGRRRAVAAASAVLLFNIAATDFSREGQYAEAKRVALLALSGEGPLFTDALNVNRARFQLRMRGWSEERASAAVRNIRDVKSGALVFKTDRVKIDDGRACVLKAFADRKLGFTHAFLRETGISTLIGGDLERRTAPPQPALLLRVLVEPGDIDPATGKPCLKAGG